MHLSFKRQKLGNGVLAFTIGLLALLIAVPVFVYLQNNNGIKRDQYQLVKLTTGEIFFGKLQNTGGDYLVLENGYFIQDSKDANDTTLLSRKTTVAKSESPIRIKSDKVVYWENLAKDSKVVEMIKNDSGN